MSRAISASAPRVSTRSNANNMRAATAAKPATASIRTAVSMRAQATRAPRRTASAPPPRPHARRLLRAGRDHVRTASGNRNLFLRIHERHLPYRRRPPPPLRLHLDPGPEPRLRRRQPAVADVPAQPRRIDRRRHLADLLATVHDRPLHVVQVRKRIAVELHA